MKIHELKEPDLKTFFGYNTRAKYPWGILEHSIKLNLATTGWHRNYDYFQDVIRNFFIDNPPKFD